MDARTYREAANWGAVNDARYLVAENAGRYRLIVRYFCDQVEQFQRDWLGLEEVLAFVREIDPLYSETECEQALAYLVDHKNLIPNQDRRAATAQEYVHRRMLYHVAPRSIEIDRMMRRLESGEGGRGSLDGTLMDVLWNHLANLIATFDQGIPEPQDGSESAFWTPWREAWSAFERLRTGAGDFHAALSATRPEDLNKQEDFEIFRDVLIRNLSSFINRLLHFAPRIRAQLRMLEEKKWMPVIVTSLARYHASQHADGAKLVTYADARERYEGQAAALVEWWTLGRGADVLRQATESAISIVVGHSQRLVARSRAVRSREADLIRTAAAFASCRTAEDAHRLAARVYRCAPSRHVMGNREAPLLNTDRAVWEQKAHEVPLRRIRRGPRRRPERQPVEDQRERQAAILADERAKSEERARIWAELLASGSLTSESLEIASDTVLNEFLRVLGLGMASASGITYLPNGQPVRVTVDPSGPETAIRTGSGTLYGPPFRFDVLSYDEAKASKHREAVA